MWPVDARFGAHSGLKQQLWRDFEAERSIAHNRIMTGTAVLSVD
jgi:hypothetical protein